MGLFVSAAALLGKYGSRLVRGVPTLRHSNCARSVRVRCRTFAIESISGQRRWVRRARLTGARHIRDGYETRYCHPTVPVNVRTEGAGSVPLVHTPIVKHG